MNHSYTPRRCSSRWLDGDCPRGVLAILDNRGESFDRYTVFYADPIDGPHGPWISYRAMSENPTHPQGFGIGGELPASQVADYRHRNKHRYVRWTDLPEKVKDVVRRDLEVETSN